MIYNNDVAKAPVIASRKVSIDSLSKGSLPFFEKVEQEADVKKLQSLLPLEALATGRVVLDFDDKNSLDHPVVNKLPASTGKIIKSTTGQLIWDYNNKGYFTINTRGTQGVVGFLPDHPITLNDFTLHCSNNFAVITATSLTKGKQLSNSNRILITTIARARNTGMKYNENETELLDVGTAPLLLEPVRLEATINRRKNWKVYVLDHTGNRTALQVPVKNRKIILDGSTYKAIYYELVSQ
jgi:hypothetical protein